MVSSRATLLTGMLLLMGCAGLEGGKDSAVKGVPTTDQPREPPSDEEVARIYMEKGVQYMEAGQYALAQKDLQKAVDLDDDNSEAHNALGVLYQRLDNKTQAEANFRRALSLSKDNDAARNNYGRFLCTTGRSDDALALFRAIVAGKIYPQPWIPLTNAGLCSESIGQKADAERYYREALQVQHDFPPALLEMAKLERDHGRPEEAKSYLQRYDKVAQATPESLALGAEIESALGNRQAAVENYQTLRARYPDTPELMRLRQRLGL